MKGIIRLSDCPGSCGRGGNGGRCCASDGGGSGDRGHERPRPWLEAKLERTVGRPRPRQWQIQFLGRASWLVSTWVCSHKGTQLIMRAPPHMTSFNPNTIT